MVAHDKKNDADKVASNDLFEGDNLLARALRGEHPRQQYVEDDGEEYSEFVEVRDDGVVHFQFVSLIDGGVACGDSQCSPGQDMYQELESRHGELSPGKVSHYLRYKDGHTELK